MPLHLRHDLTGGPDQPVDGADQIWEKYVRLLDKLEIRNPQKFQEKLICYQENPDDNLEYKPEEKLKLQPGDYLELLEKEKKKKWSFQPVPLPQTPHLWLESNIYPLRIHDTYIADLTLGFTTQPEDI